MSTELVINTDIDLVYPTPSRELKPYEYVVTCPECGSKDIVDLGEKFFPQYACNDCPQMFTKQEIKL